MIQNMKCIKNKRKWNMSITKYIHWFYKLIDTYSIFVIKLKQNQKVLCDEKYSLLILSSS